MWCSGKFVIGFALVTSTAVVRADSSGSRGLPDASDFSLVGPIWAADVATAPGSGSTPAIAPEAQPRRPLMSLLDQVGIGRTLDDARVDIYGHIEVGYTRNFKHPPKLNSGIQNYGRVFDGFDNHVVMNQLDLNVERRVDASNHQWDIGGRVELLYGTDAAFIHASGIGQHPNVRDLPDYELDPVQLYVDGAIPVGNGLTVRAGKFLYFYAIDPSENVFYSHGFGFEVALPLTLTGISAAYPINERLSVEGGVALGWDEALRDNNDGLSYFGRVSYDLSEDTGLTLRGIIGPEQDQDTRHYRYAMDVVVSHRFSDNLTLVVNPVFGFESHELLTFRSNGNGNGIPTNQPGVFIANGHDAYWYGVSGTTVLKLDKHLSAGARGEVYRDDGGFTTQYNQWLFEVTLGVTVTPFPDNAIGSNLKIRPEVRYDYSSSRVFDGTPPLTVPLRGGIGHPQHDQFTFGIDAYFNF